MATSASARIRRLINVESGLNDGIATPVVLAALAGAGTAALESGTGFIAAFAGALAFGTTAGRRGQPLVPFVEETGALVSLLVWLAFGAVAIAGPFESLTWQLVLYAVLSLTVIRMAPGGPRAGRRGARSASRRARGLVRSPGPGICRLRAAGA